MWSMLRNYIKTAFRNFTRNKVYSFINIFGLAVGVALFIIISLFIHSEFSYDRFNEKINNIYRLDKGDWGILGTAYGPDVKRNFPEVKEFARFSVHNIANPLITVGENEREMRIQDFLFADTHVFDVFTFDFLRGNPQTALKEPYSVVLTESMAAKLFGNGNAVGETIMLEKEHPFKVTGIIKDVKRFHLNVNAIAEFSTLAKLYKSKDFLNSYGSWNYPTYLLLKDGVNIPEFEEKLNDHFEAVYQREFNTSGELDFHLTALEDIYFDTDIKYEIGVKHGNIRFIYIFIAIALFILLIASINFINLTTAKASIRAKEVGLRKVVGGAKRQLVTQFLSESLLISLFAFLLALGFTELLMPRFNELLQGEIYNHYYQEPFFWMIYIAGILLVGLLSGLYPAFYLTAFDPVSVMKERQTRGRGGSRFRRVLTVFQFFISVILIIGTVTIYRQIHYMKNKDLGFNKEHQVYFNIIGNDIESAINHMRSIWNQFVPGYPFEYHFLDQMLDRQYKDDERFGSLFSWFAFFAILIACLGLYGLSLFATQRRTKEIGIRKANGAGVNSIVTLFLKDFTLNVLVANLIAWPAAYFFMTQWLNNFPYRTEFEYWIFGLALVLSLLIAVFTVSWQTLRAANTNPAWILRDE